MYGIPPGTRLPEPGQQTVIMVSRFPERQDPGIQTVRGRFQVSQQYEVYALRIFIISNSTSLFFEFVGVELVAQTVSLRSSRPAKPMIKRRPVAEAREAFSNFSKKTSAVDGRSGGARFLQKRCVPIFRTA